MHQWDLCSRRKSGIIELFGLEHTRECIVSLDRSAQRRRDALLCSAVAFGHTGPITHCLEKWTVSRVLMNEITRASSGQTLRCDAPLEGASSSVGGALPAVT